MIGKSFVQIIAKIPADTEPICRLIHQLPLGTNAVKKHDQLKLKEDDGIDRGTPCLCIALLNKSIDKRQIELLIELAIKVVLRDQILERDRDKWSRIP